VGTWSATGGMTTARGGDPTATLLPSGKVLVTGGHDQTSQLASAELYDPAAGTWSATGSMSTTRHSYTATLLPSGKVLVAGGWSGSGFFLCFFDCVVLASAELYDPATGTWSATGSLSEQRDLHTATLLPSGEVLVAGGFDGFSFVLSEELYDPAAGTWSQASSINEQRGSHSATLLPSGAVLLAGGFDDISFLGPRLASAELYDPLEGASTATGGTRRLATP
jgi:Kelch motif